MTEMKTVTLRILIILTLVSLISLNSCDDNSRIDLSESWINYKIYKNSLDGEGSEIKSDTLFATPGEDFIIKIWTQSNDASRPKIYKQVDENDISDISTSQLEAALESEYTEEGVGHRQINRIDIQLPNSKEIVGQKIKYNTEICSKKGTVSKKLCIVVK